MRRSLVLLAVLLALAPARRADAGPDEEYVLRVKEGLAQIDREKAKRYGSDLGKETDEELARRRGVLVDGQGHAHRNWRRVQAAAEVLNVAGRMVEIRWAHHALAMWTIEVERKERIDAIHARENEITQKRYGEPFHSIFVPKLSRGWPNDPEYPAFREEEKQVQRWFADALRQQKGEAEGGDARTAAALLDEMRKEAMADVSLLNGSVWAVDKEVARRKGVDLKTPQELELEEETKKRERGEEHARYAVRLVPYRTEYEARPGEVVAASFQVFRGAPDYLVLAHHPESTEGPRGLTIAQAGDFVVPFTFRRAGEHEVTVRVVDAQGESASASIVVRVAGEPLPPEKQPEPPPKPPTPPTPPPAGPAPVATRPISGTFDALAFHLGAGLADPTAAALRVTPVPLRLEIAADGAIRGTARYAMPEAEMKPKPDPAMTERRWKSSFDLVGRVDWSSGKVHLELTNGLDESGFSKDDPKLGHWRQFSRVEYASTLDGWAVPGPDAAAWLGRLGKIPGLAEQLKGTDLETLTGLPNPVVGPDGSLSFATQGFLGSRDLGPTPGSGVFRRHRYAKWIDHMGYDGRNATDADKTAEQQKREDARQGGAWHLKVLGATAPTVPAPPADAGPPDPKSDLLAFGLWPSKPVTVRAGATVEARAMGVYRENVFQAQDRSSKVAWTSSDPALEPLGGGRFRATKPGTYTVTARTGDGPSAMTSTLTVKVE